MILIFGLTLWLGAYLLMRGGGKMSTLCAGGGLIVYAIALACQILSSHIDVAETGAWLQGIKFSLLIGLVILWLATLIYVGRQLLPWQSERFNISLQKRFVPSRLLEMWYETFLDKQSRSKRRQSLGILLFATIAFALAVGGLLTPISWIPQGWLVAGIGVDVLLMGYAVAELDAFELGESLRMDFLRSLDGALLSALLFGGPVALTLLATEDAKLALWSLLLITLTIAILTQVFAEPMQVLVDGIAFRATPAVQQERSDLRKTANTLPRLDPHAQPELLDQAELARHTRRALSHYGDLARLSTNPLTRLALIDQRIQQKELDDNTLTRAAELKRLLSDGIAQLKPSGDLDFDSTEEWRYYNALYFPYVAGIKPYSRRAIHSDLAPDAQQALAWFQQQVPERTLHNWQNAAAKLVAQYLRELDA